MEEDLPKMWENLTLTEDEDVEAVIKLVELKKGENRGKACIIRKLLADRLVSKEALKTGMIQWWRMQGNLDFKVLGDNLFLVEFDKIRDKERVLEGRPWVFEGSLFLTEDFVGISQPTDYPFDKATFWVQITNLPLACMGWDISTKIGETMGSVEAVDTDGDGMGWGEYLRVKIRMDIIEPLPRGRKLNIEGKVVWVMFKYQCLPKFCFHYGVLNHNKIGCAKNSELQHPKANLQYGPWLRVASPTIIADRNKHAQRRGQAQQEQTTTGERGRRNGRRPTREDDRKGENCKVLE
jgi:hypothetical protein